ncbi:hypothetical protein [Nonomuraea jiangxiensis]|uniref:Protein kinase domain-containing protein n=1 Tax=Nonomuraea jiangxiensis TaxID=633440 RepID=A0A1G9KYJ8_9ACTN|nr:hypothetical protein [Nonomuraea jiangxiensis]SDL54940.1 hypothetical protein SAMN05421869_12735 [Nonomuraea jiangxiensis]
MGDQGASLAYFVRHEGPLGGRALHHFAVSCMAALARLHGGDTAGLRMSRDSVALGGRGQVLIGWETSGTSYEGAAADDVRAWADLVVFAATGTEDGDPRILPPALRLAVEQCRHPDPGARPRSVDVLRVLLGRSVAAAMASVDGLLSGAHRRVG